MIDQFQGQSLGIRSSRRQVWSTCGLGWVRIFNECDAPRCILTHSSCRCFSLSCGSRWMVQALGNYKPLLHQLHILAVQSLGGACTESSDPQQCRNRHWKEASEIQMLLLMKPQWLGEYRLPNWWKMRRDSVYAINCQCIICPLHGRLFTACFILNPEPVCMPRGQTTCSVIQRMDQDQLTDWNRSPPKLLQNNKIWGNCTAVGPVAEVIAGTTANWEVWAAALLQPWSPAVGKRC